MPMSDDGFSGYVDTPVTINGKPTKVSGYLKDHPRDDFASHGLTPDEFDAAMCEDSFDTLPRWNEV